ncbi:hypothetical protein ACSQ67_002721 [Phaseolus vulgaris]
MDTQELRVRTRMDLLLTDKIERDWKQQYTAMPNQYREDEWFESEGPSDAISETQIMKSVELAKWKVRNHHHPFRFISFGYPVFSCAALLIWHEVSEVSHMTNVCGTGSFWGSRSASKIAAFHFAYFPNFIWGKILVAK